MFDNFDEIQPTGTDVVSGLAKMPLTAATWALDVLDTPRNLVAGMLTGELGVFKGLIPGAESVFGLEVPKISGREVLEDYGFLSKNKKGFDSGDVAGFGADVLLDPLTYLGVGLLTKAGKTTRVAQSNLATIRTLRSATERIKNLKMPFEAKTQLLRGLADEMDQAKNIFAKHADVDILGDLAKEKALMKQVPERALVNLPGGGGLKTFNKKIIPSRVSKVGRDLFSFLPESLEAQRAYDVVKRLENRMINDSVKFFKEAHGKLADLPEADITEFIENMWSSKWSIQEGKLKTTEDLADAAYEMFGNLYHDVEISPGVYGRQLYDKTPKELVKDLTEKYESLLKVYPKLNKVLKNPAAKAEIIIRLPEHLYKRADMAKRLSGTFTPEELTWIEAVYSKSQEDILRNLDLGVREAVLDNPTLGYVHHLLSAEGKQFYDEVLSKLPEKGYWKKLDRITRKNFAAEKRGFRGTVKEVNEFIQSLPEFQDWIAKTDLSPDTLNIFLIISLRLLGVEPRLLLLRRLVRCMPL
jgi:hypothetical protein